MQFILPPTSGGNLSFIRRIYEGGKQKVALTRLDNIGDYVARIVEDERTLNRYVFVWEEELTQTEMWTIASRISGIDLESIKVKVSICAGGFADYLVY